MKILDLSEIYNFVVPFFLFGTILVLKFASHSYNRLARRNYTTASPWTFPSTLFRRSTMSPTKDPVVSTASKIPGITNCKHQTNSTLAKQPN